jgi:hypothetical protein
VCSETLLDILSWWGSLDSLQTCDHKHQMCLQHRQALLLCLRPSFPICGITSTETTQTISEHHLGFPGYFRLPVGSSQIPQARVGLAPSAFLGLSGGTSHMPWYSSLNIIPTSSFTDVCYSKSQLRWLTTDRMLFRTVLQ